MTIRYIRSRFVSGGERLLQHPRIHTSSRPCMHIHYCPGRALTSSCCSILASSLRYPPPLLNQCLTVNHSIRFDMAGTHPLDPWMGQGQGHTEYGVWGTCTCADGLSETSCLLVPGTYKVLLVFFLGGGFCDTDSWIQTAWTYRFSGS